MTQTKVPPMPTRAQKFFKTLIENDIVANADWEYSNGSGMTEDARSFVRWVYAVEVIAESEES